MCFFAWEATWGKSLTLDHGWKRGLILENRCFLCQESEEMMTHILLHCTKTRVLELLFSLYGVPRVIPSRFGTFFKEQRRVWKVGPLCIFREIWKARNNIVHVTLIDWLESRWVRGNVLFMFYNFCRGWLYSFVLLGSPFCCLSLIYLLTFTYQKDKDNLLIYPP